ncbi:MAG: hypothetical protein ACO3KZ_01890 [Ilumatobacteraceae bacterium]
MADLSPAAREILIAYWRAEEESQQHGVAAALRAAADQTNPKLHIEDIDYQHQLYVDGWKDALDLILVIADELDNIPQQS